MSQYGSVKYYDPEDLGLIRRRADRERRGHAHHGHGRAHAHAPVQQPQVAPEEPPAPVFEESAAPPAAYLQALVGHEVPPYDPNVDAYARGVDVTREAETHAPPAPVRGSVGAACSSEARTEGLGRPSTPHRARESGYRKVDAAPPPGANEDLTSLSIVELAAWCALVYLPARFGAWILERRSSSSKGEGSR
jgi:hypothetical protein